MTEFAEDHYVSYDVRFTFSSLLAAPIAELLNRTLGYAELIGISAAQVPDEALSTSIEEPLSELDDLLCQLLDGLEVGSAIGDSAPMDTKERLIDLAETHVSQLDSVLKREIGGEAYERTVPGARVHLRLLEQIINALVTRLRNEQASRAAGLSSGRWRVLSAVPASNSAAAAVTEGAALDEDCGPTGRQ